MDGPEGEELDPDDMSLNALYLSYGITLDCKRSYRRRTDLCTQQALVVDNYGEYFVTEDRRAINTFDNSNSNICWGTSETPDDLQSIEIAFTAAKSNEDLLDFESHNDNADEIENEVTEFFDSLEDPDEAGDHSLEHISGVVPLKYEGRPLGVASVSVEHPASYVYLTGLGGTNYKQAVFFPVSLYRNVALTDDVVTDVWIGETTTGQYIAFLQPSKADHICIGTLPKDFDLSPCKSLNAQSSAAVAQDKHLSPA